MISKDVSHPLPSFRMVSYDKIKRDRASVASPAPFEIPARSLSGEFLAPALPDAAVARVVFSFAEWFRCFCFHSSFSEVLCALWIFQLSIISKYHYAFYSLSSVNAKFFLRLMVYFEFDRLKKIIHKDFSDD